VFGNLRGDRGLPDICSWAPELWLPERRASSWAKARTAPGEQSPYFTEPAVDTRSFLLTTHNRSKVIRKLPIKGPTRVCNFVAPMEPLDCLPRAERDKYAEHNDSDFANERAPSVQRFGNVEVHAAAPSGSQANRRTNVRNCS
jgi:hypothetical protein